MSNLDAAIMAQMELRGLNQAVELLTNYGRITRMHVATGADVMPMSEVTINSADLVFPQEVIDSIVAVMQTQIGALEARLADAMKA